MRNSSYGLQAPKIMSDTKLLMPLILSLMLTGNLRGSETLPAIPASDRILTMQEVRHFWINTLLRMPVPPKPTGLYPKEQAAWKSRLEARKATIAAIEAGQYGTEARMAQLAHNAAAWRNKGNEEEAKKCDAELRRIEIYLAKLETLELQRYAARAQIEAAERIKAIEAEISSLTRCSDH